MTGKIVTVVVVVVVVVVLVMTGIIPITGEEATIRTLPKEEALQRTVSPSQVLVLVGSLAIFFPVAQGFPLCAAIIIVPLRLRVFKDAHGIQPLQCTVPVLHTHLLTVPLHQQLDQMARHPWGQPRVQEPNGDNSANQEQFLVFLNTIRPKTWSRVNIIIVQL